MENFLNFYDIVLLLSTKYKMKNVVIQEVFHISFSYFYIIFIRICVNANFLIL